MSPVQRKLHEDTSPNRFALWANKLGKTYGLSAELWADLQRTNPHGKPLPPQARILYVVPDLDGSYADDVCASLRELEPPDILHESCRYDRARGYLLPGGRRGILTADGDIVVFRSSHQELTGASGVAAHKLYINEPPKQAFWGEIVRSVSETNGQILAAMTLVNRLGKTQTFEWLREIVVGEGSEWSFHHAELSIENAPHRTEEDIRRQILNCPIWEYDQRILAMWDAAAVDRLLQGFDLDLNVCEDDCIPDDAILALTMDHGERPGAQVIHFNAHWGEKETARVHVIDRYASAGRTTTAQDAFHVQEMVETHGYTLEHIKRGRGDTNSAGKDSEIRTINLSFQQAFAALCGRKWSDPPFKIIAPDKRPGSREYGLAVMNRAFLAGALTINPRCKRTIHEAKNWKGGKGQNEDGELSHGMDSLRYDIADVLDTTERGYDRAAWNRYVDQLRDRQQDREPAAKRRRREYGSRVGGLAVGRHGGG